MGRFRAGGVAFLDARSRSFAIPEGTAVLMSKSVQLMYVYAFD
jgi:hypothetical protein